jgi:hypothetical protein
VPRLHPYPTYRHSGVPAADADAPLYGMNFAVMPELSWKYGFTYSMLLALSASILRLWYIKRRGWLR